MDSTTLQNSYGSPTRYGDSHTLHFPSQEQLAEFLPQVQPEPVNPVDELEPHDFTD